MAARDGVLGGTLSFPDGRAVAGLGLEAWHELVATRAEGGLSDDERVELELDRGLVIGAATTDDYGAFTLGGFGVLVLPTLVSGALVAALVLGPF